MNVQQAMGVTELERLIGLEYQIIGWPTPADSLPHRIGELRGKVDLAVLGKDIPNLYKVACANNDSAYNQDTHYVMFQRREFVNTSR